MAKAFISDDEMEKMAPSPSPSPKKSFISDDEMDAMDNGNMMAAGQAGLEHFGNGAAMGYLPHLQAATQPAFDKVGDLLTGSHVYDDDGTYTQRRDENIARMKQQEKDHPIASTVGTIGGTAASALAGGAAIGRIPGMAKLATLAPGIAEGATEATLAARTAALAGRTGASAASAGIQGAISNPGDVEGEFSPIQAGERAKQGALSATIAAPLHLAGEGVSTVGSYISDRLKDKAEKLAFRALGPFKRQVNQNRDEINQVGREALDSGIVSWKPAGAATLEERASEAAGKTGQELGDLTDKLGALENEATKSGMSRKQIADNLRGKLTTENPQGIPGIDKRNATFGSMIEEFEQDPMIKKIAASQGIPYAEAEKAALQAGYQPKPMSFKDLRQAKMNVQGTKDQDGLINWNRLKNADIPTDEQFHRALAGELRSGEESGADAIEKAFYGEKSNQLKNLKDKYGNLQTAATITGNKADAQRANQILGLKDALYGSAGASLGGTIGYQVDGVEGAKAGAALGGSIGAIGNKIARDYGSQMSAKTADALSKILQKSPMVGTILQRNPTLIPQLVESLERQNKR